MYLARLFAAKAEMAAAAVAAMVNNCESVHIASRSHTMVRQTHAGSITALDLIRSSQKR
jgi:hypothetical protein